MNEVFEKILERLEDELTSIKTKCYTNVDFDKGIYKAQKIVQEVAGEYNGGWIPCSERLPEDGTTVLVQDFEEYYEVSICETRNGVKGFSSGDWWTSANNYIAWQPLPEPYKERD